MLAYKITTTGTQDPVVFSDIGMRTFTHPTTDHDLMLEFTSEDIVNSEDIKAAVVNGHIIVKDENDVDVSTQIIEGTVQITHAHLNVGELNKITDGTHDTNTENPHGITKVQVGLGNVPNTNFTTDIDASNTHRNLTTGNPHEVSKIDVGLSNVTNEQQLPLSMRGAPNGVPELGSDGKVPISQLSISSGMEYKGNWNADTNSPSLGSSGTGGSVGYRYTVSVAGSTPLDGTNDWSVGDWIVHNGTIWEKVDNTESVSSVNGEVGPVLLNPDHLDDTTTVNKFVSQAQKNGLHSHVNKAELDNFQTGDRSSFSAHVSATGNPHNTAPVDIGAAPTDHPHSESDITDLEHNAVKIQGIPISGNTPNTNNMLAYNGAMWVPTDYGAGTFGLGYSYNEELGLSSTSSTIFQNKLTLTTTLSAGTYRYNWYMEWNYSTTSGSIGLKVHDTVNDILNIASEMGKRPRKSNDWHDYSGFHRLTVPIEQQVSIYVDYKSSTSGTSFVRRAKLEIWRVS